MYIERDALYQKIGARYKYSSGASHKAYGIAIDDVLDAPAVDVASVRHGRWIAPFLSDGGNMCAECSNCHKIRVYDDYCSACGAIMDLNNENMED